MKYKRVYLTEKSSQVKALAVVENAKMSGQVAYNVERGIAIVPLQGHLLINEEAKTYSEKYDGFIPESLLKFPKRLKLRPNPKELSKYNAAIEHLKEAEEIIIATDYDNEGAAIALNMIEKAGAQDRIGFMLSMGSTHPEELRKTINKPDNIPYQAMAEAGRARAWIDFVEGMYLSRAASIHLGNNYAVKLNYGGVKAPLAYIVVQRDLAFDNHKVSYFWTVKGFAEFNGQRFPISVKQKEDNSWTDRFETADEAVKAIKALNKDLKIEKLTRSSSTTIPPKLYELTSLQADMSKYHRVTPNNSMDLAQTNYDYPYSIQAYPRTEIPYLKSAEFEDVSLILSNLKDSGIIDNHIIDNILKEKLLKRKTVFNDEAVLAHGAIIPTKKGNLRAELSKLPAMNQRMFELVSKRYVANFMKDYEYVTVSGESEVVDKYKVVFTESVPVDAGWKELFEPGIKKEISEYKKVIPVDLKNGSIINLINLKEQKGETKPKPPFTMAELLKAMKEVARLFPENEDIKKHLGENGIGTPATRATIIEDVMDVEKNNGEPWLVMEKDKVRSTQKARDYIAAMPIDLVSPIKRALLSKTLKDVERGKKSYDSIINDYLVTTDGNIKLIEKIAKENGPIKGAIGKVANNLEILGPCPLCAGSIVEKKNIFACSNAKYRKEGEKFFNDGCTYMIMKTGLSKFGKNNITKTEVKNLLKNKKIRVKLTSKANKQYEADVVIDEKWGIKVEFIKK